MINDNTERTVVAEGFLLQTAPLGSPSWSPHFPTKTFLQAKGAHLNSHELFNVKPMPALSTLDQKVERERNTFFKMKEKLLSDPEYADKFVAIIKGDIVDADNDKGALIERIFARYGYVPVFIGRVTREQTRSRRLPSPRRA